MSTKDAMNAKVHSGWRFGWGNFLWSPTNRFNNGLVTITTNEVLYYFEKYNSLKLIKDHILRS